MDVIEKGEFFEFNTENRVQGFKLIAKELQKRTTWDKGRAVQKLQQEEIYDQKQDCKDFLKNLVRCRNTEVVSTGKRQIGLTGKTVVTNQ